MTIDHPAVVRQTTAESYRVRDLDGNTGAVKEFVTDEPVKCDGCGRTIAWKATRPYLIACRHCKADTERL